MRVSPFQSFLLIFAILFSTAFSEDVTTSFVLNQLPPADDFDASRYTIKSTEHYSSIGELELSEGGKCQTTLKDSDGNVFFEIRKNLRHCVIHSFINGNERSARVYAMQGTFCNVFQESNGEFSISAIDNGLANCRWNGKECADDAEGLKVDFILEGNGFSLTHDLNLPWASTGGRVVINEPTNGYTVLTNLKSFIFLNVTNKDGSSWCIVSSEAHLRDYHAMSMVYQAYNALCKTTELAYHQFKITAEKLDGANCLFDGLRCQIDPNIIRPIIKAKK